MSKSNQPPDGAAYRKKDLRIPDAPPEEVARALLSAGAPKRPATAEHRQNAS
ncbi:MAG: hypothetical protein OXQ89_07260 [Rhodospirillaceae bacterium]|nr:hypothetical protein [Rhodospirillaceae bacterium]